MATWVVAASALPWKARTIARARPRGAVRRASRSMGPPGRSAPVRVTTPYEAAATGDRSPAAGATPDGGGVDLPVRGPSGHAVLDAQDCSGVAQGVEDQVVSIDHVDVHDPGIRG